MSRPPVDRFMVFARKHPEILLFGFGVILFAGGLISVMSGFLSSEDDPAVSRAPQVGTVPTAPKQVGPPVGEALPPYIDAAKQRLRSLAASQPRDQAYAVVSFSSYKKVGEVEAFFKARRMQVLAVHVRIPLTGFVAEQAKVTGTIHEALGPILGAARIATLEEEAAALEEILPKTTDPAYRQVYEMDIERMRKAAALLAEDPSAIHGVLIRATHANLARMLDAEGVRLVDVGNDPGASPATHAFVAILPEQTDRA